MSIRVSFKLSGNEKIMAMALQRQLREENGGEGMGISTIVERLFVNWMHANLIQKENADGDANMAGADNAGGTETGDRPPITGDALPISEQVAGS